MFTSPAFTANHLYCKPSGTFIRSLWLIPFLPLCRLGKNTLLIAVFLLVLSIVGGLARGQTSIIEWQKALGGTGAEIAQSIQQTTDGGYIVAGRSVLSNDYDVSGNHGDYDFWVVKLDAGGNIVWQKCLGGSSTDEAYSIQQTTDGGYVVAGRSTSNNGDVTGNHGTYDYWVVKLKNGPPLPVRLMSFEARLQSNHTVQVSWTTASEENNQYFVVERSQDGRNFSEAGRMPGCGTCSGQRQYQLLDRQPFSGTSFYRLKQVDKDGTASYSPVQQVSLKPAMAVSLYPNPTTGKAFLYTSLENEKQVSLQVRTLSGSVVLQHDKTLAAGNSQTLIDLGAFPAGIYVVHLRDVKDNSFSPSLKIVKQ